MSRSRNFSESTTSICIRGSDIIGNMKPFENFTVDDN